MKRSKLDEVPMTARNPFWFCVFLVCLLVLGIYSWYSIDPVDLHTKIEHYILAPYSSCSRLGCWSHCYGYGCTTADGLREMPCLGLGPNQVGRPLKNQFLAKL